MSAMFLGFLALRRAKRERILPRGATSRGTHCPGSWPAVSSPGTPGRTGMRSVMPKVRVLARTVAALLLAALAVGARSEDQLTTADLVRFLKAGISEGTILTELKQRGFGEPLDAARE